jgi:hypothetical protein
MTGAPDYATVAITAADVDDHRQPGFVVEAGVGWRWIDATEQQALGERVAALRERAEQLADRSRP